MLDPIATTVLAIGSLYQGERSRSEAKKARRAQDRISARQTQRERVSQLRESQIARATGAVQAEGQGVAGGSASQGVQSSIQTTAASNVQFINSIESLRMEVSRRMQKSQGFAADASNLASLASLSASFVKPTPTGTSSTSTTPNTSTSGSSSGIGII